MTHFMPVMFFKVFLSKVSKIYEMPCINTMNVNKHFPKLRNWKKVDKFVFNNSLSV